MRIIWLHNFRSDVKGLCVLAQSLAEELRNLGVHIDLCYMGNLRDIRVCLTMQRRLQSIVKDYDVIHAQYGSMCGYLISRLTGNKVLTLRGTDFYGVNCGFGKHRWHGMLQKILTRSCLKKYAKIVVMSERMKSELPACYKEKVEVIPSGINLDQFKSMPRMEARKLLQEGLDGAPWVLFPLLSITNPIKRVKLARAAFLEAKKQLSNLQLKVIKGCPHNEMPTIFNACDVVLLPSLHEGWPNVVKEGLACNVPFVSTDVSDLRLISEKARNCFVEAPDAVLLGQAIVNAVKIGRSINLRQYVVHMDVKNIALKLLSVYRSIIT